MESQFFQKFAQDIFQIDLCIDQLEILSLVYLDEYLNQVVIRYTRELGWLDPFIELKLSINLAQTFFVFELKTVPSQSTVVDRHDYLLDQYIVLNTLTNELATYILSDYP
jgi:hypothetical protein